jgi:hypothetical protein
VSGRNSGMPAQVGQCATLSPERRSPKESQAAGPIRRLSRGLAIVLPMPKQSSEDDEWLENESCVMSWNAIEVEVRSGREPTIATIPGLGGPGW